MPTRTEPAGRRDRRRPGSHALPPASPAPVPGRRLRCPAHPDRLPAPAVGGAPPLPPRHHRPRRAGGHGGRTAAHPARGDDRPGDGGGAAGEADPAAVRRHGPRPRRPVAAVPAGGAGHLGRRPPAHGKPEAADGHERSVEEDGRAGCRSFPLRYVPPGEPDLMARSAGMRPRHRRDGWSRVPFTAENTGQVPVYRRPAGRRGRTDGRRPCPCGHPALPRRLLTQAARRVTVRA